MAGNDLAAFQQATHGATAPGHQYLAEFDPAYFQAFRAYVADFINARPDGVVPEKWRHLINLSVLASSNAWDAARLHLRRALLTGVTPKEILQVLEIASVSGGMATLVGGVGILKEELDALGRTFEGDAPAP
jgi:alkylhydroperoxidase/carboxymuconolactone decarboxylase family protein YurZ